VVVYQYLYVNQKNERRERKPGKPEKGLPIKLKKTDRDDQHKIGVEN
jgi:hypothetical protein